MKLQPRLAGEDDYGATWRSRSDSCSLSACRERSYILCELDTLHNCPGRSAIRIYDLQRKTDKFICTRFHFRKVEAFDEPDTCLQQRMMGLDSIFGKTSNREIINADDLRLLRCKIPGSLL